MATEIPIFNPDKMFDVKELWNKRKNQPYLPYEPLGIEVEPSGLRSGDCGITLPVMAGVAPGIIGLMGD